jgi:hypothetical protein
MPVNAVADGFTERIVQVLGQMPAHKIVGDISNPNASLGCWLCGAARHRRDTLVGPGHNAPPGRTAHFGAQVW